MRNSPIQSSATHCTEMSQQFFASAIGIVWRVVYPDDPGNTTRLVGDQKGQLCYDVMLWANRAVARCWAGAKFASTDDGEETVLRAATDYPSTDNREVTDSTPFTEMRGSWVLVLYAQGLASWPIIVTTIAPPYNADKLSWVGSRELGRRMHGIYNLVEYGIDKEGNKYTRITEPASDVKPADWVEKDIDWYAGSVGDPAELNVHFHKEHFAIRQADPSGVLQDVLSVNNGNGENPDDGGPSVCLGGTYSDDRVILGDRFFDWMIEFSNKLKDVEDALSKHTHAIPASLGVITITPTVGPAVTGVTTLSTPPVTAVPDSGTVSTLTESMAILTVWVQTKLDKTKNTVNLLSDFIRVVKTWLT